MPSFFDQLAVVLVATRNPLNIGAGARAMSNFGFSDLRVVNPYEVAFREAKSAVGAAALLRRAREFSTVAEAIADCCLVVGTTAARERKVDHPLHPLQRAAVAIRRRLRTGKVALLFGSEKTGLSNADFSHCDWLTRIPTSVERPSMNLGQAVAVCLFEITRTAKVPAKRPPMQQARAAELERLTEILHELLRDSGYAKKPEDWEVTRRLVRRIKPSADDAQRLLGMLRQILWKVRHP